VAAEPVTSILFTELKTTDPASNWANIYVILTKTLLIRLWISIGLRPSAVWNSIKTLCLVCTSTSSAILHFYCVESTWLTGAPMILFEVDSVAIRWVRKETLTGTTFKSKNSRHSFRTDLRIWRVAWH
jgi:hypothetical protein